MINLQNIQNLKYAGNIMHQLLDIHLPKLIIPGITDIQIENFVTNFIIKNNCIPALKGYKIDNTFLHSICFSANNTAIHGFPTNYIVKENDIIKIDCVIKYKNLHVDAARTYLIKPYDQKKYQFIKKCEKIFLNIIDYLKPKMKIYDLALFMENQIKQNNFGNLDQFTSHHIGKKIHEKPLIHSSIKFCNNHDTIKNLFTIEPVIIKNKNFKYIISKDKWSIITNCLLTFHKEETILFHNKKKIILTTKYN